MVCSSRSSPRRASSPSAELARRSLAISADSTASCRKRSGGRRSFQGRRGCPPGKGASPVFSRVRVQSTGRSRAGRMIDSLLHHLSEIWRDDRGADLVEYGLIALIIALAGVVVFPSIFEKLGNAFETWGNDVYEAWEPEDPG